jgi:molybdopterin molybdotransferase
MSPALVGVDLSWDAARDAAHAAARPVPTKQLPLTAAVGATLAQPVTALHDLPSADRSAMDGFAVRGVPPWTLVGELRAEDAPMLALAPGSAVRISTGAPVPAGTDAVLPAELSTADDRTVRLLDRLPPAAHIRRRGEECRRGEVLVVAGTPVTPQIAGLAAALGYDTLEVHPPPRIAALITGNELQTAGVPGPGQVRDAIGPMLPGLIRWAGGRPVGAVPVPDLRASLTDAIAASDARVLLVSGSSSVGPADHLRPCLVSLGAEFVVDGVTCRPGHPQSLALLPDGRAVVGLPGNPLAALVAFLTLAAPLLAGLTGRPPATFSRAAAAGLTAHPTSTRLTPVRLLDGVATAVTHAGSAMLRGVAAADAIAVVPPAPEPPKNVNLLPLPR